MPVATMTIEDIFKEGAGLFTRWARLPEEERARLGESLTDDQVMRLVGDYEDLKEQADEAQRKWRDATPEGRYETAAAKFVRGIEAFMANRSLAAGGRPDKMTMTLLRDDQITLFLDRTIEAIKEAEKTAERPMAAFVQAYTIRDAILNDPDYAADNNWDNGIRLSHGQPALLSPKQAFVAMIRCADDSIGTEALVYLRDAYLRNRAAFEDVRKKADYAPASPPARPDREAISKSVWRRYANMDVLQIDG